MCNDARVSSTRLMQVSSLQAGGGSDPPEREDTSILLSEWYACVFLNSADVYQEAVLTV